MYKIKNIFVVLLIFAVNTICFQNCSKYKSNIDLEKSDFSSTEGGKNTGNGGSQQLDPNNPILTPDAYNGFVPHKAEAQLNRINWNQFSDISLPPGHYSALGYGVPVWSDDPVSSKTGKLKALSVGHTHMYLINKIHSSQKYNPDNLYQFKMLDATIAEGAKALQRSGSWKSEWGDINPYLNAVSSPIPSPSYAEPALIEIGKAIQNNVLGSMYNFDSNSWSNSTFNNSWVMVDTEIHSYTGSLGKAYGLIQQGMQSVAPNRQFAWYGSSMLTSYDYMAKPDFDSYTDAEIIHGVMSANSPFYDPTFRQSNIQVETSIKYFKVPYIDKHSIYKRNSDGSFILVNGKRVFRTDDFEVENFGFREKILANPDPQIIKYDPNRVNSPPDSKGFLNQVYQYADQLIISQIINNRIEFGHTDISKYKNRRIKNYVERRPRTEPWTDGGNSVWSREIGAEGLKYQALYAYLSGISGVSTWDDGEDEYSFGGVFGQGPIKGKLQGDPLYNQWGQVPDKCPWGDANAGPLIPCDDNYSRYIVWTSAVQTFAKAMKNTDQSKWQYIRFYYPIKGAQNREVISAGIYTDNALKVMFVNPAQDPDEQTEITIKMGDKTKKTILKGRQVYFYDIPLKTGLVPKDFELSYKNIYGQFIRTNGVLSSNLAEHYLY